MFDSLFSSCADESLTNGNENAMFARTTEFGPFGPPKKLEQCRERDPTPHTYTQDLFLLLQCSICPYLQVVF